jgi:NitT/TauT family transport system substrate-binding protein
MLKQALAATALSLLTAVPAAAEDAKPMKLILNFLAGGPQASFMYAKKLGLYAQAGIDLTIEEGRGSATTAQLVATGQTDVGFVDAPAAMQIRSKGGPVKIIASLLQTNAFAIIALESSGIRSPQDLVGKRLAVQPGTAQTTLLEAIFIANKIDKDKVNVINTDPAAHLGVLLEKKVDAILGGADFHSVQLRDRGQKITELYYRDIGVPTVGLSIVARDDKLAANPDLYRRFVEASLKGLAAASRNPEAAAAATIEAFPTATQDQVLKQLMVGLAVRCAAGATGLGKVPEQNWQATYDLLTGYLGLPKAKPVTDYYSNDYLPADLPSCGA